MKGGAARSALGAGAAGSCVGAMPGRATPSMVRCAFGLALVAATGETMPTIVPGTLRGATGPDPATETTRPADTEGGAASGSDDAGGGGGGGGGGGNGGAGGWGMRTGARPITVRLPGFCGGSPAISSPG